MNTIFSQALDTNADAQNGNTYVLRWETAGLSLPVGGITLMRFTFEAGSTEGLTVTNAYVEHAAPSGDAYDFLQTPTQVLFAGSASKVISAGATAVSDWVKLHYNKTSALLLSFYLGGGAGSDMVRYKAGVANFSDYYKAANDAATVNKTGYTGPGTNLVGVNKIEVICGGGGIVALYC